MLLPGPTGPPARVRRWPKDMRGIVPPHMRQPSPVQGQRMRDLLARLRQGAAFPHLPLPVPGSHAFINRRIPPPARIPPYHGLPLPPPSSPLVSLMPRQGDIPYY